MTLLAKRLPPPPVMTIHKHAVRNAEIKRLYMAGMTLQEIGDKFEVSRQYISQLLHKMEVDMTAGGSRLITSKRKEIEECHRTEKLTKRASSLGVSVELYAKLKGSGHFRAWKEQKRNALNREIPFKLNLGDWWNIWVNSGKLIQRGKAGHNYTLSRKDIQKPFEVGNVEVVTLQESSRNSRQQIWDRIRKEAIASASNRGDAKEASN